ncbi:MAG TPA: hypothetical protein VJ063_06800 [Verrucomicrobiae bacterium]|nr:hypothetical protein [Verrucomicrobiae bacterium]
MICYSPIDERHRFTGACKQIVAGQLVGAMSGLAICQYAGEGAFYLFGCDSDWQAVTDTWHQTLDDAKHQAEFEYEGISKTWIDAP